MGTTVGGTRVKMAGNVWIFSGGGPVSVPMDSNPRTAHTVGYTTIVVAVIQYISYKQKSYLRSR